MKRARGAPLQKHTPSRRRTYPVAANEPASRFADEASSALAAILQGLPEADNAPGAVDKMLQANGILRNLAWPKPFDRTVHRLHQGDARDMSWLPDESAHLVVTSPPYWTLKEYEHDEGQLGDIEDYEKFLDELDKVWVECARILAPGGRVACVVGDVCIPRKRHGRHYVMPLHADIQVRARRLGLDCLTPILWHKIANGVTEAKGNGAGFYGKPYQPGAIIKNDVEYIVFLRKGGEYRSPSTLQRALSMLNKEEMQGWLRSSWTDIKGESTRRGHPAPYPVSLAERLIKMFSFVGDTILDPFSGTGTTALAAMQCGRNSVSNELEPRYHQMAEERLGTATWLPRGSGSTNATVIVE
jgi:DNA modification methylase